MGNEKAVWLQMKWLLISLLILCSVGCATNGPSISQDEACSIVYRYMQSKVNSMPNRISWDCQKTLNFSMRYFKGNYQGEGKWDILALGYYQNSVGKGEYCYDCGKWYVFEKSQTVQPANQPAYNLLQEWQRY
jgi:hypothetical protein